MPTIPDDGQDVDDDAQQGGVNKILYRIDVLRDARDQIACPRFSMLRERQPLNAVIEQQAEIVRHPLADAGRQVFFDVRANGADDRDEHHRGEGELQHRRRVVAEHAEDRRVEQSRQTFPLQNVVDDIVIGQGSSTSPSVSPTTATSASASAFQCGRRMRPSRNRGAPTGDFIRDTSWCAPVSLLTFRATTASIENSDVLLRTS